MTSLLSNPLCCRRNFRDRPFDKQEGLHTMSLNVPDAVPGFDFLAFFATIAVVLGAFYGGYICWTLGLDVAQATKATAYGTWAMFNIAGDFGNYRLDLAKN